MPIEEKTKNLIKYTYFRRPFKEQKYYKLSEAEEKCLAKKRKELTTRASIMIYHSRFPKLSER